METLHRLLLQYPYGLNGNKWEYRALSCNPTFPPLYTLTIPSTSWMWYAICQNCQFDLDTIKKLEHRIDWDGLSLNHDLPLDVVEEYIDELACRNRSYRLNSNRNLTLDIVIRHHNLFDTSALMNNKNFMARVKEACLEFDIDQLDRFPRREHDRLSWGIISVAESGEWTFTMSMISRYIQLTPELLAKYNRTPLSLFSRCDCLRWDWDMLCYNKTLTPEMIDQYSDKFSFLGWRLLSQRCQLEEWLVLRYVDMWNWYYLSSNPNLNLKIIINRLLTRRWDWSVLSSRLKIIDSRIIDKFRNKWDWDQLSLNTNLNLDLLREFRKRLNWSNVSEWYPITLNIMDEFDWDYGRLLINPNMNRDLFRRYEDKFVSKIQDWKKVNVRILPLDLIIKYSDRLDWEAVSRCEDIPYEFIVSNRQLPWTRIGLSSRRYHPSHIHVKSAKLS